VGFIGIEEREQAAGRDGTGRNGKRPRVFVVEDEALIGVDTADTLEHQGFEVHLARSGEDALHRLQNGLPIDILFTDINLAGAMDGATLARLARALNPDLMVVYTSGTLDKIEHRVAGSVFVAKPYSPERVGQMLTRMGAPRG